MSGFGAIKSFESREPKGVMMMTERELVDQKIRNFMEGLWERGDPWDLENSAYERDRCVELLKMLEGRRYRRVLEIGCGAGYLTRMLARSRRSHCCVSTSRKRPLTGRVH